MSPSDEDLERLLRKATPAPRPSFVEALERSLGLSRGRSERRRRLVIAGVGVACTVAGAAVVARVTRRR